MSSICFYFQVHQPYRVKPYSYFNIGEDHTYHWEDKNEEILRKVAEKCYLPMNQLLLELIEKHQGEFKVAFSISGVAIDQFEEYGQDVLDSFKRLADTGCVEFLSETYHHSLSYLYSKDEFKRQVKLHSAKMKELFGVKPKVFRNTELIFNNELAGFIEGMGYKGMVCEGVDRLLDWRSPNFLYKTPTCDKMKVLLKNYSLSDDIAFRFSDKNWESHPLTSEKFAKWAHQVAGNGDTINLFMDYETFGEHQWESTGIFEFMRHLPEAILRHPDFSFKTPSETLNDYPERGIYDAHDFISWADTERDLSAWLSNDLQYDAASRVYGLEKLVKRTKNAGLIEQWARLLTSDHLYYMCTKYWADGDVHKYFSPYDSPYEAYMYFMNTLADFEAEIENTIQLGKESRKALKKAKEIIQKPLTIQEA